MGVKQYPAEIKAKAVAMLLAGSSVTAVSKQLDMPFSTVASWYYEIKGPRPSYLADVKSQINGLLIELVTESLITLIEHQRIYRDVKWVKSQSANSIAILNGVSFDKVAKVINALAEANDAITASDAGRGLDDEVLSRVHSDDES